MIILFVMVDINTVTVRDVYRSLVASQELIYITGWSVWAELSGRLLDMMIYDAHRGKVQKKIEKKTNKC